jgi:hypothetical protein
MKSLLATFALATAIATTGAVSGASALDARQLFLDIDRAGHGAFVDWKEIDRQGHGGFVDWKEIDRQGHGGFVDWKEVDRQGRGS